MMPAIKPEKMTIERGHAFLAVDMVSGQSAVTATWAASPLKILVPQTRGRSTWAFSSSFGGGLVAGDQTRLEVKIGAGARAFLGTQASTKIYRNPASLPCSHFTRAEVGEHSLLVFAPDPVQAFAGSAYAQRQEFHLAAQAGLVLVDWLSSGRAACGERWQFSRFQSRNDVWVGPERVFTDSLLLDQADHFAASAHRVGRFNCFATLFVWGALLKDLAAAALSTAAAQPVNRRGMQISSASHLRDGVLLRVAGESVEGVGRELHHLLKLVTPLLGDDPWRRKW